MAEEPEESIVGGEEEIAQENSREVQLQSRALDSITDHVEDRQLDSRKVEQAMASIHAAAEADKVSLMAREKELAAVKLKQSDIDVIVNQLEVDRKVAERALREHKGDAVAALRSFLV